MIWYNCHRLILTQPLWLLLNSTAKNVLIAKKWLSIEAIIEHSRNTLNPNSYYLNQPYALSLFESIDVSFHLLTQGSITAACDSVDDIMPIISQPHALKTLCTHKDINLTYFESEIKGLTNKNHFFTFYTMIIDKNLIIVHIY